MATVTPDRVSASFLGIQNLPLLRQLGLMVGLSASVALGVVIVLWSQSPGYVPLFTSLSSADTSAAIEQLRQAGIDHEIDARDGTLLVAPGEIHAARLKLAENGLPRSEGTGFELLDTQSSFGTSQFIESARYQRALEGELARTISSIDSIRTVRVHLATPTQSVFVRDRRPPSASVFVYLQPGRLLKQGQVQSIVNLVSGSVPSLDPGQVTVVDQHGSLLSSRDDDQGMGLTSRQFDYSQRIERAYMRRIEDLLTPIVGVGKVRVQVVADINYAVIERTEESYSPDGRVLRSENTHEERTEGRLQTSAVPGALSNQPPAETSLVTETGGISTQAPPPLQPMNSSLRATRNFEIGRTIERVSMPTGTVQRLSVAVLVDDLTVVDEFGEVTRQPLDEQKLALITSLVREAVGFSAARGDSLQVINSSFLSEPEPEPLPEIPLIEQPWVWNLAKSLAAALGVLLLIMMVLRPVMRSLAEKGVQASRPVMTGPNGEALPPGMADDQYLLGAAGQAMQRAGAAQYEEQLNRARTLVGQDPKRVARVVKDWVATDG